VDRKRLHPQRRRALLGALARRRRPHIAR
jgi:hypothetical protein